ncbi:MAG: HIT domain-containing protein [Rhizobiales bacterium]|nr:HIT domain-containing protein [Hyphomicrobiales bacterium]
MKMEWALDGRLAADTIPLGDWPLSRVLLTNDARYPWLILAPRRAGVREIVDLDAADRSQLLDEITQAGEALRDVMQPDKLNVAALGNVVAQLHIHVIARFHTDAAWPKPVWGVHPACPYAAGAADALAGRLRAALRL